MERQAQDRAVQPAAPVYLGMIGCLTYRSAGSGTVYVTGFSGDLHLADTAPADGQVYRPAYDAIVGADGPVKVGLKLGLKLKTLGAWTD